MFAFHFLKAAFECSSAPAKPFKTRFPMCLFISSASGVLIFAGTDGQKVSALSRSPFYKALELWLYRPLFLLLQCEHVSGWPMGQITAFDSSFRVEIQTRMVAVEICCHLVKIFWPAWEESLISELSSIRSGHITKKRKVTTAANHTKAQTQGVIYHTLFHFPLSVKLSRKLKIFTMENSSANEEKNICSKFCVKTGC